MRILSKNFAEVDEQTKLYLLARIGTFVTLRTVKWGVESLSGVRSHRVMVKKTTATRDAVLQNGFLGRAHSSLSAKPGGLGVQKSLGINPQWYHPSNELQM